jgi:predicted nuclease of predicted toxin-antitoxin system
MNPVFLVDESSGQAVIDALRQAGYNVVGVSEVMPQAGDEAVIAYAAQTRRVLVTNDKDFGEHVYRRAERHSGVLLLRPDDDRASTKARLVLAVVAKYGGLLPGNFTVATERRVRVRQPPS